jgi:hypothetical protein
VKNNNIVQNKIINMNNNKICMNNKVRNNFDVKMTDSYKKTNHLKYAACKGFQVHMERIKLNIAILLGAIRKPLWTFSH